MTAPLTIEQRARAALSAGGSPAEVARDLALELGTDDEGRDVVLLLGWVVRDGSGGNAVAYPDAKSGAEAAAEYVADGAEPSTRTEWVTVRAWRVGLDADGDCADCGAACASDVHPCDDAECPLHGAPPVDVAEVKIDRASHRVTIDPDEPDCVGGDGHAWASPVKLVGGIKENPGCWGHGGGVIIDEACLRCGCRRQTDTWAQDPTDGTQGLRSVEYAPGHYDLAPLRDAQVRGIVGDVLGRASVVAVTGRGRWVISNDAEEAAEYVLLLAAAVADVATVATEGEHAVITWRAGAAVAP